jgi:KaiC/GvpD/RAD55 family RecA-like ATPase
LFGGFNRGELNIFAGGSGAGKSLFLANLGVNYALAGLNVIYLTLELSEELVSMRIDSMVTGISTREVFKQIDEVEMKVKDTSIVKVIEEVKKDTIKVNKSSSSVTKLNSNHSPKSVIKVSPKPNVAETKPIVQVAAPSTYVDDQISKSEILKALDSLATLKREQERIVEYLTKRINKKPIDVFVSSDSVTIEIYDNAIHDKDSVSIIFNNRIIVDKQELKVNKPIKFKLKVDKNKKFNELILVAENLGSDPPNTAVMFVTEKNGRRQQIMLSTDMLHNEVVYFIRIGKE